MIRHIQYQGSRTPAGDTVALWRIFARVLGGHTRGVIVEAIVVGVITSLGYALIGIEVWLPLGAIALVGELVPIIGPWIALAISLPVILATQPDKAILALGLFAVIQFLGSWILAPRIQGRAVHFTPLATLIVLGVGGMIAGPLGIIFALPVAALLRDVSFYTSYRARGHSPTAALGKLPLFQRETERRAPAPMNAALPPS